MRFSPQTLRTFFFDKRVIAALLVCLCIAGALVVFLASRSSSEFAKEYAAYAVLAQAQQTAAYVPAAPDNPVRQQLDLVLSETLDSDISSSARLDDAQQGLALVSQLEAEVDTIGDTSDKANVAIAQMQVSSLSDFSTSALTQELISLAKQRSGIIEDIRGLSYRADFETIQIFQGIITDKGALTAARITALNDEIPQVETEFDQRSALYTQLTSVSTEIDQKAAQLGPGFALTPSSASQ